MRPVSTLILAIGPAVGVHNAGARCSSRTDKVTAREDGSFTVTDSRNNFSKTYEAT